MLICEFILSLSRMIDSLLSELESGAKVEACASGAGRSMPNAVCGGVLRGANCSIIIMVAHAALAVYV